MVMKMLETWLALQVLASCPVTDVVPPVFGKPSGPWQLGSPEKRLWKAWIGSGW